MRKRLLFLALLVTIIGLYPFLAGCQRGAPAESRGATSIPDAIVEPSLSLAASTVWQNGDFGLSVEGFAPGEAVVLRVLDEETKGFKDVGRAKADLEGRINELTIELPSWVTSGARKVEVLGQSSGRRAESTLYVRAEKPWLSLAAYATKQDGKLGLATGGFEPGENVSAFFEQGPQKVLAMAVADQAGNVDWLEIGVRGVQAGQYNLILLGETSQTRLTEPIVITPRVAWVDLHTYAVGPGGAVGFDGHGFAPEENVRVFLDEPTGTPLLEAAADDAGNVTVTKAYAAKPSDVGRRRLIFVGELTNGNISTAFDVMAFTPSFQMTTYSGPPGTETSFNGNGFAPGEKVHVFLEGREQPVATIEAGLDGSFTDAGRFMVPRNANGGNLGVRLMGDASGARLMQGFSVVRIQPFLGLDVYAGPPGTVVRFRGLGFAAGENVKIHLGNREGPTVATARTDLEGRFAASTPTGVPGGTTQDVAFTAIGEESGVEAQVRFQVILPVQPSQGR